MTNGTVTIAKNQPVSTVVDIPMTAHETMAFERFCEVVDEHIDKFIAVGEALANIKNGRLYRAKYPGCTFEQFVEERWGKSRQWAYQQISARAVAMELGETVKVPNERIARALLPLDDPDSKKVALSIAI